MSERPDETNNANPSDTYADDAVLMAALARGEERAAAQAMKLYLPAVLAYARRLLPADGEAEDIGQEVFVKLWQHADKWQEEKGRLKAWLMAITRNACLDKLRRKRVLIYGNELDGEGPDVLPDMPGDAPGTLSRVIARDEWARMHKRLMALPERQRTALLLFSAHGLSQQEISEILGVKPRGVESLIVRARRALRQDDDSLTPPPLDAKAESAVPAKPAPKRFTMALEPAPDFKTEYA